ncbi:MAG: hypothetical protein Fur0032_05940 [Terrimicrobiaceae bacterium]
MNYRIRILSPPGAGRVFPLANGVRIPVGSGEDGVVLSGAGVAAEHAVLEQNEGAWFVHDFGAGTFVNGVPAEGWTYLPPGSRVRFGGVECVFEEVPEPAMLAEMEQPVSLVVAAKSSIGWIRFLLALRTSWRAWLPSLALHVLLILLLTRVVITAVEKEPSDFTSDETSSGFLVQPGPKGEPPGGEAAAGPSNKDLASVPLQVAPPVPTTISAITTTSPNALQFSIPAAVGPSAPSASAVLGNMLSGRGGGGSSFRSAGFGKGSGFGKGVGEWIGGGSGGIGISGRGKTLKTVNEFSVYFVIHSGDWYAALDTRKAPEGRNQEISDPGLPDSAHIKWGTLQPVEGQGPFINYFWGGNWRKKDEDNRRGLVEFTPGAMGNLLRFVRQASGNAIKGAAKPAGVVLDKSLVPYSYNKATKQFAWLPEGREKLRETLRKGLPEFTNFYGGAYGYIWNPKPEDPAHPDFTVEYLLDVRPMPPFVYFTGNDDFVLSDAEVETLYQYVLRGGAIWGDCGFAGARSKFDVAFKREMKRVIPDVDKNFRPLKKQNDLFIAGPDAYFDKANDFTQLPYGMQFYEEPVEVIEMMPGLVSVVLTRNAYGNFLRFETAVINNRFQVGGQLGRGTWASTMWNFREEFFRGLGEGAIIDAYKFGTNVLVYMLGRWPAVLNRPENKALMQ